MTRRSVIEHREAVDALLAPLGDNRVSEPLPVSAAALLARPGEYRGRILADDLLAPTDLPAFDNSQMDGYAVSWFDLVTASPADPVQLLIAPQIAAGDEAGVLLPSTAAPIMTGAPVPPGADAIVPIEQAIPPRFQTASGAADGGDVEATGVSAGNHAEGADKDISDGGGGNHGIADGGGNHDIAGSSHNADAVTSSTADSAAAGVDEAAAPHPAPTVSFIEPVTPGTFIRRAGSDVAAGETLLPAGSLLGPAQLGVIAGTGLTEVSVLRRIRVLLISTGHEIREAGSTLEPGQIFDSNSVSMSLALIDAGCDVTTVPCRSDDAEVLLDILSEHAAAADLVMTIGGVSAGAREVVRDALGPLGVEFGKVAMQPGGPQGFGLATIPRTPAVANTAPDAGATPLSRVTLPVLCLPGNPVSALVSFEMFVRPALRRLSKSEPSERLREVAMMADAADSPLGLYQVRRGFVAEDGTVAMIGGPSSHLLHSYASSNALVHIPADVEHLDAGDPVMVWRIDD